MSDFFTIACIFSLSVCVPRTKLSVLCFCAVSRSAFGPSPKSACASYELLTCKTPLPSCVIHSNHHDDRFASLGTKRCCFCVLEVIFTPYICDFRFLSSFRSSQCFGSCILIFLLLSIVLVVCRFCRVVRMIQTTFATLTAGRSLPIIIAGPRHPLGFCNILHIGVWILVLLSFLNTPASSVAVSVFVA